jgi:hypothetical protein
MFWSVLIEWCNRIKEAGGKRVAGTRGVTYKIARMLASSQQQAGIQQHDLAAQKQII